METQELKPLSQRIAMQAALATQDDSPLLILHDAVLEDWVKEVERLESQRKALLEAAVFTKEFLGGLEDATATDDPLSEIRRHFHAPLHAKLDAAIALVEPAEPKSPVEDPPAGNTIKLNFALEIPMDEFQHWQPQRITALFRGIAETLSVRGGLRP